MPDAGKEISPAELRQLQRLSPGDPQARSWPKNSGSKEAGRARRSSERRKDLPFAAFAKAWDDPAKENADKFGLWIGPAGLFNVAARRTARKFFEDQRLGRLNELIRKGAQKFETEDFDAPPKYWRRPIFR